MKTTAKKESYFTGAVRYIVSSYERILHDCHLNEILLY